MMRIHITLALAFTLGTYIAAGADAKIEDKLKALTKEIEEAQVELSSFTQKLNDVDTSIYKEVEGYVSKDIIRYEDKSYKFAEFGDLNMKEDWIKKANAVRKEILSVEKDVETIREKIDEKVESLDACKKLKQQLEKKIREDRKCLREKLEAKVMEIEESAKTQKAEQIAEENEKAERKRKKAERKRNNIIENERLRAEKEIRRKEYKANVAAAKEQKRINAQKKCKEQVEQRRIAAEIARINKKREAKQANVKTQSKPKAAIERADQNDSDSENYAELLCDYRGIKMGTKVRVIKVRTNGHVQIAPIKRKIRRKEKIIRSIPESKLTAIYM